MTGTIGFRGAIFDLDGTVLDSMGVWKDVDERFFAERGIETPEDYARAIQGKSFLECAEYTRARFGLPESLEEMMAVWTRMSMDEYAHHVQLKPGARAYLRMLKRAGVKLAVASANRREVFMPCLERLGIAELFDAVCTAGDVGDRGKGDGALFRHAAARLDLAPEDCAVFEDTCEGIAGASRAGMAAWAMKDAASAHDLDKIAALADGVIGDFAQMPREDNRRRCVIFTAHCEGDPRAAYGRGRTTMCSAPTAAG